VEIKSKDSKSAPVGVEPLIFRISVGCRCILTRNLFAEVGLHNEMIGICTEILEKGADGFPKAIFFRPKKYHGPRFLLRLEIIKIEPITT